MGRIALFTVILLVATATAAGAASSGLQPYTPSNSQQTYTTTSGTFGTATATIQETSGPSGGGGWAFCAHHAVAGPTCAAAAHAPAGTVSKWIVAGQTTLVTLPNGAQCYQHVDSSGANWCYAGEPVQDSIPATGGPFGTAPATSIAELPNQGESWWGSGGGPNDSGACEGMFGYAPSNQASLPSCEQQFGTVTWDTSGGMVASINSTVDEMAWRIGSWSGGSTPGGVTCGGRTAIGGIAADSQAPDGLWMQWAWGPDRGFWNCTSEDHAAGPPQPGWNGNSWYSRSFADWNGFGWYLVYYDYASFIETPATVTNGVATSIGCDGFSSGTTVSNAVPSQVSVAIDEASGLATFTDQSGTVLSEVSCTNSPTSQSTVVSDTSTTTTPSCCDTLKLYAQNYALSVPVGDTGAVNVLSQNVFHGIPQLTLTSNAPQPGVLDADPNSIDFGYFRWSPTYVDQEVAHYQMCDSTGCASAEIDLSSTTTTTSTTLCTYYCGNTLPPTTSPPTTRPKAPNVTLSVHPTAFPSPGDVIYLTAKASNPTSPSYDLRIEQVDDSSVLYHCGQVLGCDANDYSPSPVTRRYVAVLSYPDGSPSQYSNEVTVTWGGTTVVLTACPGSAPCADVATTVKGGAPAYLTATTYKAPPIDESHQVFWRLVVVDAATRQPVGTCPIGETPCQVSTTGPGGTEKNYVAMFVFEHQQYPTVYSNTATARWTGTTPTTTTAPTTTVAPTTSTTRRSGPVLPT